MQIGSLLFYLLQQTLNPSLYRPFTFLLHYNLMTHCAVSCFVSSICPCALCVSSWPVVVESKCADVQMLFSQKEQQSIGDCVTALRIQLITHKAWERVALGGFHCAVGFYQMTTEICSLERQ